MADPETEQMMNDMMAEVMRPPTEEEAAMMMSMMEELMKPPTEEEMAEMEQAWEEMMSSMMSEEETAQIEQAWMDWEAQMEEEWKANGGLMGMMGMTGEGTGRAGSRRQKTKNKRIAKLDHWRRHWLLLISVGNSS